MSIEKLIQSMRKGLELYDSGQMTDEKIAGFARHFYLQATKLGTNSIKLVSASDVVDESLAMIIGHREGTMSKGLYTRFEFFNHISGLIQRDATYVIGARPGIGKTAFNIILQDDIYDLNKDVAIAVINWNWEMANYQSMNRFLSKKTNLTLSEMLSKHRPLPIEDFEKLKKAATHIKNTRHNMWMVDVPSKLSDVENVVLEFTESFKEDNPDKECYVINSIDHTLLAQREGERNNQELVQSLSKTALRLKKVAHVTNIILSQLKEDAVREERRISGFRPKPSDLVWSQELEQDADAIILLHDPSSLGLTEYRVGESKFPTTVEDILTGRKQSVMFVEFAKNRYGAKGVVPFKNDIRTNNLEEITKDNVKAPMKAPSK